MRALLRRPLGIWAVATATVAVLDLVLNLVAGLWRQAYYEAMWPGFVAAQHDLTAAVFAGRPDLIEPDMPPLGDTFEPGAALQQALTHGVIAGCALAVVVLLAAAGQRVLAALGVLAMVGSVGLMAGPLGTVVVSIPSSAPEGTFNPNGVSDRLQPLVQRAVEASPYTLAPTWWAWLVAAVVGVIGVAAMIAVERSHSEAPARVGGRIAAYALPVTLLLAAAYWAANPSDIGSERIDLARTLLWWTSAAIAGLTLAAGSVAGWKPVLALTIGWGASFWLLLLTYGYDGGAPRGWGHDADWSRFPEYASTQTAVMIIAAPIVGFALARLRDGVVALLHRHDGRAPLAA